MSRVYRAVAAAVGVAFLVALMVLAREQNGPPPHEDRALPGGIPATFYLPGTQNRPGPEDPFYELFPSPPDKRPPGIVLLHGFTGDRVGVSTLARRLAQSGYGVLAIDLRGHGANRNPFNRELLGEDVAAAVDFLRRSSQIDPTRIVVIGHSMGAGAALDYASRDDHLSGAVMISGGFRLDGPHNPRNALFIFAENDLPYIPELSRIIASRIAGVGTIELGKPYGDFANGTALEAVQVPETNHLTIIRSVPAARQIIAWLDSACGVKRESSENLADPRLRTSLIVGLLFLLLLIPVGRVAGGLATIRERRTATSTRWIELVVLSIALFVAMPLVLIVPPAWFLSLVTGDAVVSWIAIAGVMLLAFVAYQYREDLTGLAQGALRSAVVGVLAVGAVYAMAAFDVTVHRATFTPERLGVAIAAALLALPFFIAFELLLRWGGTVRSTILTSLGLLVLFIATLAGLRLGALPFGVMPLALEVQLVTMEIFSAAAYSVSGDLLLIAIFEAFWFVRTFALTMPITFRL